VCGISMPWNIWSRRLLDRGQRAPLGKALITCADRAAPLPVIWRGIPPRGELMKGRTPRVQGRAALGQSEAADLKFSFR
jgi:hypothetical protein